MPRSSIKNLLCAGAAAILLAGCASDMDNAGAPPLRLEKVADFDHQVTGVTVSKENRVFVNFPRWTEDAPVSVAEITKDGDLKPYPDGYWNSWRNTNKATVLAKDHFVCVQSVVVDKQNNLWVVDAAAPDNERIEKDGPKLVKINLATNQVEKIIPFDMKAAPQGSYLNDIRFSPDGKTAYLTDSGKPALIVVNTETGKVRRVLEDDVSTKADKNVVVKVDGHELRRPDGRAPEFNADGIAISPDGSYLFWQALTGTTLYRIPTAALRDEKLAPSQLAGLVERVGDNGVADGLWMDDKSVMYVTAPEENAVKVRNSNAVPKILVQKDYLRWPDTLSQGPDGAIYVTTSHIQDSPWFKPGADSAVKSELWKLAPAN